MVERSVRALAASLAAGIFIGLLALGPADAEATHEQIVARCREAARPSVVACVRARGGRRDSEAIIAACRQAVGRPIVIACVRREEQKLATGKAAPPAPKQDATGAPNDAAPVSVAFVPPPRSLADITAILDQEKPEAAKISARKSSADVAPPPDAPPEKLAQFYYDRGAARALLARNKEALADGLQALEVGKSAITIKQLSRIRQFVGLQYQALGDPKQAMRVFDSVAREGNQSGVRGTMINALTKLEWTSISIGDLNQAATYANRVAALVQEARGSPNPRWRTAYKVYGNSWEADADSARAMVYEAHGQYADAEAAYRRAEAFRRASLKDIAKFDVWVPPEQILQSADRILLATARNGARQQRLAEAEAEARRALLEVLDQQGKYSPFTPTFIVGLADILVEQGRYSEAEKLTRAALDIRRKLGIRDDSSETAGILSHLGNILVLERQAEKAAAVYEELDRAVAQWPPQRREVFELNGSRILALYAAGQIGAGIAAAEELVKRCAARGITTGFDAGSARSALAYGYSLAGRDAEAVREFKTAIPLMMAGREDSQDDDPSLVATRKARLQRIVEAYISVLARTKNLSDDIAVETFGLADAVRGSAVRHALAASSARALASDPALAALARTEQDFAKQIGAQLGALNNLLSLPSEQRDEAQVRAINAEIDKLRTGRKAVAQEIKRKFPAYANLIDPKPATPDQIKSALHPDEVLLSFYFGQNASFVWAVRRDAMSFAVLPVTARQLEVKVRSLRRALEPDVATVAEIPPFDLDQAYELYGLLLKPTEAVWKSARSLIVVTNGALGELPLGLLPTAPVKIDLQAKPMFAGYRAVPWLARRYAVTRVPSASALVTLRRLPRGPPGREELIGFGDPYFNAQEEAEGDDPGPGVQTAAATESENAAAVTRGMPLRRRAAPHTEDVDSAELALLPRLADTRAELIAVAKALGADPARALYLGKAANEQNVETIDLTRYRIVAFATHGLVPGDLDGLMQPALALTAPDIAGVKGNGLLTMEKILALKLDADWVVLSACNTAAGAGAGAEAASGLGSAFFYAGTRALLLTNWSVHSASARELIAGLFRRQGADHGLSRAEALRQAMMDLVDGPGFVERSGDTAFTYAHPLFWAPYSVIGDGGGT